MKRRWLIRIFYVAFAAFNLACYTQWYLDPSRHFGTAFSIRDHPFVGVRPAIHGWLIKHVGPAARRS